MWGVLALLVRPQWLIPVKEVAWNKTRFLPIRCRFSVNRLYDWRISDEFVVGACSMADLISNIECWLCRELSRTAWCITPRLLRKAWPVVQGFVCYARFCLLGGALSVTINKASPVAWPMSHTYKRLDWYINASSDTLMVQSRHFMCSLMSNIYLIALTRDLWPFVWLSV